jgi:hypothetical protein
MTVAERASTNALARPEECEIVCQHYSNNGNTGFHYYKEIAQLLGPVTDYQIASYIEDIR